MCGIARTFHFPQTDSQINETLETMHHRGPDAQLVWLDEIVTLFHSRLSILDTDARSNQPFVSEIGRYILVFNGEIYNYQKLKSQLPHYPFKTAGDTEVLLAWLMEKGENGVADLDGMFAFCLYDTQENTFLMGRDGLG